MPDADAPARPDRVRDRSPEARRAARATKAGREARIVGLLNGGASMAEIAAQEGVTLNRMRKVVRAIIERRAPRPPADFLAIQMSRLNAAMNVSYGAMVDPAKGANLKAVGSVVRIVREMNACHGGWLDAAARSGTAPRAVDPSIGLEMAPEGVEETGFGVGEGWDAGIPPDAPGASPEGRTRAPFCRAARGGLEKASQPSDKAQVEGAVRRRPAYPPAFSTLSSVNSFMGGSSRRSTMRASGWRATQSPTAE
jgi:hypothetical protein